jgi:hypothetical protein
MNQSTRQLRWAGRIGLIAFCLADSLASAAPLIADTEARCNTPEAKQLIQLSTRQFEQDYCRNRAAFFALNGDPDEPASHQRECEMQLDRMAQVAESRHDLGLARLEQVCLSQGH